MFQVQTTNTLKFDREVFRIGDIVDINSKSTSCLTGKIVHIGNGSMEIDISRLYSSNVKEILFNDILSIRHHEKFVDPARQFLPRI